MSYDFEAANDTALFFGLGDWYFLSSEEKERLHADKMEMESYGKQSRDARQRNLARASARRAINNKGKDDETQSILPTTKPRLHEQEEA